MAASFQVAFPDAGGAVCSTFFPSVDVSDKLWAGIERLAGADDLTFWTVVANHDRLPAVLLNVVTAVDHAHSSHSKAQRRAVAADGEQHVIEIVLRLATATERCSRRHVESSSFAARLGVLLPWKVLFPASLMLLRHSGAAASVALTSLILLNPGYLCTLNTYMPTWWDGINRFAVRCARELQRGRFQRLPGDIISTFEQVYRLTKQFWAVVQCAPFLADYLSLPRTLRALRVVVDVVSPILQHFIIVCDELTARRAILSRANAVIVNAAINASSVLLLYHTFSTQGVRRQQVDAYCVPPLPQRTYSQLREYLRQYGRGFVEETLQAYGNGSFLGLIHFLYPPLRFPDDPKDGSLGHVLLTLTAETADSNDFSEAVRGSRQRVFELLLLEVVRQGVHIDDLLARHLLLTEEAKRLGASEDTITCALAGVPTGQGTAEEHGTPAASPSPPPAAAAMSAPETADDPLVAMVMEVFPQYSANGVRAALNFYSNDVEQFIMDASMENLPPHLVGPLTATGLSDAELAAALAAEEAGVGVSSPVAASATPAPDGAVAGGARRDARAHLAPNDFDDALEPEALYRLLGRDLYELVTDSDGDDGCTVGGEDTAEDTMDYKTTMNDPQSYMSDAFDVDEDMKAKIRMLNEIMYEDELDDGQQDVHLAGGDIIADASDSDDDGGAGRRNRRGRGGRGGGAGGGGGGGGTAQADAGPVAAAATTGEGQEPATAGATPAPPPRAARDDYHDKRYHEKRSKDRLARTKQIEVERQERVPAYTNKKKTSKAKAGGAKATLQRAVRKGKYDADA